MILFSSHFSVTPVTFISKSLNATEYNYEIHNKEMLAVIQCLEIWRHYLKGCHMTEINNLIK